jgi:hypothetical protein
MEPWLVRNVLVVARFARITGNAFSVIRIKGLTRDSV